MFSSADHSASNQVRELFDTGFPFKGSVNQPFMRFPFGMNIEKFPNSLKDEDDEVPDLFGPSASLRKSPARQILRQTSLPANLLSRTNSIPPHKPPTATISRMDSIANKDFNCLYWNGHDLEDVRMHWHDQHLSHKQCDPLFAKRPNWSFFLWVST